MANQETHDSELFEKRPSFSIKYSENLTNIEELKIDYTLKFRIEGFVSSEIKCYYKKSKILEELDNLKEIECSQEDYTLTEDGDEGQVVFNENFINNIIGKGYYFKIGFWIRVINTDWFGDISWDEYISSLIWNEKTYSSEVIAINTDVVDYDLALDNHFKNAVTVTLTNLWDDKIKGVKIQCGQQEYNVQAYSNGKAIITFSLTNTSESKIEINVTFTDNQNKTHTISEGTYWKASNPVFSGDNLIPSLSQSKIKPLSLDPEAKVVLTHPRAVAVGTTQCQYRYTLSVGIAGFLLKPSDFEITDSFFVDFSLGDIKEALETRIDSATTNRNFDNCYLTISAIDAFGDFVSIRSEYFSIDYREAPVIPEDAKIIIGHDYCVMRNGAITEDSFEFLDSQSSLDLRMFNPREGIIFKFPKATDLNLSENSSEKLEYVFLVSETPAPLDIGPNPEIDPQTLSYKRLFSLPENKLVSNGDSYIYRYYIQSCSSNKLLYFRLDITDSTGLITSCYSEEYIIMCRVTSPKIKIDSYAFKPSEDASKDLLLESNIIISDLGGSALNNVWNESYYKTYKNLEREYSILSNSYPSTELNFNPSIIVVLQVSDDPYWKSYEEQTQEIELNSENPNFLKLSVRFEISGKDKVYCRYRIKVASGLSQDGLIYTLSDYSAFAYSGKQPTMAHRPNWVGINTSSYDPTKNEVFVVEEYNLGNIVVFRGTGNTITFNLSNGAIDGAIIDGGSWD